MTFMVLRQNGMHPQDQFVQVEGLAQVIVGAGVEAGNFVFVFGFGGQEQDGHSLLKIGSARISRQTV